MRSAGVISGVVLLVTGIAVANAGFTNPASAQGSTQQYSAANIQAGYHLYSAQCALCHGANGDGVAGVNLARQQFRRASTDADIKRTITSGVAAAGMPPFQFQPGELDAMVAYIRSGFDLDGTAFALGDAARGKVIFDGKGGCTACHRVHGNGSRTAPDLSDIGLLRKPSAIQRSILQPTAAMQPINRPVHIVMRDGRVIQGRRLNEDTETVQLITRDGLLVSLPKSDIQDFQVAKTSDMPSFAGRLSASDVADVLAYLLSLRG